jgi:hypothetical protein
VVQQHGPVGVHLQQRAGLVVVGRSERDAELHGSQCQAALDNRIAAIPRRDDCAAVAIAAVALHAGHNVVDEVVLDGLAVVRHVSLRDAIEVRATHIERIETQRARDVIEDPLDDHHPLRAPETAKGGVGHGVRLTAMRGDLDMLQKVGVVEMINRAIVHRTGQIGRIAATRGEHDSQRQNMPLRVEADVVVGQEIVTLARHDHVDVAIEAQLHRAAGLQCQKRGGGGDQARLALLAAKSAAHATTLNGDAVRAHVQGMRNDVLYFRRVLGRAVDQHRPIFLRNRYGDLAFKVEVILAADDDGCLQTVRRAGQHRPGCAAHEPATRNNITLRGQCRANVEDRGKLVVRDARPKCGLASHCIGGRGDGEYGLTGVLHEPIGKDRVIMHGAAVVVLTRDIRWKRHGDDSGSRDHRCQVQLPDPAMSDAADAKGGVQGGRRQRDVVAVECLAGDVQMRAVVRVSLADDAAGWHWLQLVWRLAAVPCDARVFDAATVRIHMLSAHT